MTAPVRIERIAAGGDGVGHLADGRTVFVPRAAPGDLIEPTEVRVHARFARARLGTLLEPGPGRVEPRCVHYLPDQCGGCQLQHLAPTVQRAARQRIVGDALRRIAGLPTEDPELEPSGEEWNYRVRVKLSLDPSARRLGFHPLGKPGVVFELRRCEIAAESLNAALPALRDARRTLPSTLQGVGLRVEKGGGLHVVFRGPDRPSSDNIRRFREASLGDQSTFWWRPKPGLTRLLEGPGGPVPAGSFEQVHPAMAERVRQNAVEHLGPVSGKRVWDLYAGLGESGSLLADRGALVEGVELDREAIGAGRLRDPRPGIRWHAGKVEQLIGRLESPDAVLANPPRTGLGKMVTDGLLAASPATIVYVSCNAATLARDLAALTPRYHLTAIRCFDLFPQTAHVETVVRLERA